MHLSQQPAAPLSRSGAGVPGAAGVERRTVLGIDPGLTRCGIGAVGVGAGRTLRLVDVGVLTSSPTDPLEARLLAILTGIEQWLDRLQPDAVAVERVFAQANVSTVTGTAQVAGLAMVAAHRRGIAVASHTPSEIKAAVTGSGRAGKQQVATMVTRVLGLPATPRPADASDALALAICHAWRVRLPTPLTHDGGARVGEAAPVSAGSGGGGSGGAGSGGGTRLTPAQERWRLAEARANRSGRRVAPAQRTVGR